MYVCMYVKAITLKENYSMLRNKQACGEPRTLKLSLNSYFRKSKISSFSYFLIFYICCYNHTLIYFNQPWQHFTRECCFCNGIPLFELKKKTKTNKSRLQLLTHQNRLVVIVIVQLVVVFSVCFYFFILFYLFVC